MRTYFYSLFFLFLIILGSSCKSASKSFQQGDYEEAISRAVKKLQKDPEDDGLKATIKNAYQFAIAEHEANIRNLSAQNDEMKWEKIYNEYKCLQNIHDDIRKSPDAYSLVKPTDYSTHVNTYREKTAETYMERGERFMNKNDKSSYRQAYYEFQSALRFKPGDWAISEKKQQAYDAAVINVVILPMDQFGFRTQYASNAHFGFENELLRSLRNNYNTHFVKFYSAWDLRTRNTEPDHFVELILTNMNIGRVYDSRSTREVSKDVVTKEVVYRPDSVVKITSRITALITTTRRTLNSVGYMNLTVRDKEGRRVWSDNIQGDHQWNTFFSSYTGDARALSDEDKRQLNHREEMHPNQNQISDIISNEIMQNLVYRLRDFYTRYQ